MGNLLMELVQAVLPGHPAAKLSLSVARALGGREYLREGVVHVPCEETDLNEFGGRFGRNRRWDLDRLGGQR